MKWNRTACNYWIFFLILTASISCTAKQQYEKLVGYYKLKEGTVAVNDLQDNLDVPWEIKYYKGAIWYSLQKGEIWRRDLQSGKIHRLLAVKDVFQKRTMGALGMAVDGQGDSIRVYLISNEHLGQGAPDTTNLITRLQRFTYDAKQDSLINPVSLLHWPANTGHNGSRVLIGPNNDLFVTTGDIEGGLVAQDTTALNGKVLHLMKDGSIPRNNPFADSYIWSYGHRNQQGICFGANGRLYASEHGDAVEDEINLIEPGHNYGWPLVEGRVDRQDEKQVVDSLHLSITEPLISWTPTIAPASIVYYGNGPIKDFQNSLLLVTLKGSALHVIHLNESGSKVTGETVCFKNEFGRLRSICVDDEGQVYIGTSNRDWNPAPGFPKPGDDHILKISSATASEIGNAVIKAGVQVASKDDTAGRGRELYISYCASCHKEDGNGLAGNFPPLRNNPTLRDKVKLTGILKNGRSGEQTILGATYTQSMPSFSFLTDDQQLEIINYIRSTMVQEAPLQLEELQQLKRTVKKP